MTDKECIWFLQTILPHLHMRWEGFRKVRRQVCRRIQLRMNELGLADSRDYLSFVLKDESEARLMDIMCRITISRFNRDRRVFDFLREKIMPQMVESEKTRGKNILNIWSAGCASGEEPYTLSLHWNFGLKKSHPELNLRILATDIDSQLIERAQKGCYPFSSVRDLPQDWLNRGFRRKESLYCLKEEFKKGVQFRKQDIRMEFPEEQFSLILCRNLAFTYYDEDLQKSVLLGLVDRLLEQGYLVIGVHETLPPTCNNLIQPFPNFPVFQKMGKNPVSDPG